MRLALGLLCLVQLAAFANAATDDCAVAGTCSVGAMQAPAAEPDPFVLKPLPYAYDFLEPVVDKETMVLHHDKHHAAYYKNLNDAARGTEMAKFSLVQVVQKALSLPVKVRNNGGGAYNHALWWPTLTSVENSASTRPYKALARALKASFGSLDAFKEQFSNNATAVFGSGWVWLCVDANTIREALETGNEPALRIVQTANQDSPLMRGLLGRGENLIPFFGIDVWEHAYYLKYNNRRPEYVQQFWTVVNWDKVSKNYQNAAQGKPVQV